VFARDTDVAGFEVAMNDAARKCRFDCGRGFKGDAQRDLKRQPSAAEPKRQILAPDELHRQKPNAVALVQTVNRRDVRMVQCGQELRLPFETSQPIRILDNLGRQSLQRDLSIERRV
jgi:hypothetical protein